MRCEFYLGMPWLRHLGIRVQSLSLIILAQNILVSLFDSSTSCAQANRQTRAQANRQTRAQLSLCFRRPRARRNVEHFTPFAHWPVGVVAGLARPSGFPTFHQCILHFLQSHTLTFVLGCSNPLYVPVSLLPHSNFTGVASRHPSIILGFQSHSPRHYLFRVSKQFVLSSQKHDAQEDAEGVFKLI